MNINEIYKIRDGYPACKIYKQSHWYGQYFEIELSGYAMNESYEGFFKLLLSTLKNLLDNWTKNYHGHKPNQSLYFRVFLEKVNSSFINEFESFLNNLIKFEEEYKRKFQFIIFENEETITSQLFKRFDFNYQIFPTIAFDIEKIEWYWNEMHDEISPKIRFNPNNGEIFIFGNALSSSVSRTHIITMVGWIERYIENNHSLVSIKVALNYFEFIDNSIHDFVNILSKKYNPNQLKFIWFYVEDITFLNSRELFEGYQNDFKPFVIEIIDLEDYVNFNLFLKKNYEVYYKI